MPALTGVEASFQDQVDAIGALKVALRNAVSGRTSLWSMVDAAGNQPYEDLVKGATITAVDSLVDNTRIGSLWLRDWFNLHNNYFQNVAGLTGVTDIITAITAYGWRAPQDFNRAYYDFRNSYGTPASFFPRADLNLGSYAKTSGVFTDGSAIDSTQCGPGRIMAVATSVIGVANWTLTATLKKEDDTTSSLSATFTSGAGIGTEAIFGVQSLSANASAAQPTVSVASTAAFSTGQKVLIEDSTGGQEVKTILSIVANTSLTFTANLVTSYATASSATVTPLFTDVTAVSHSLGTNGDTANLRVKPDRTIAI